MFAARGVRIAVRIISFIKISSTCVQTLKSSWRSITTNSGYTRRWATVLRKNLNDKPSAKARLRIRRLRRSLLSLPWSIFYRDAVAGDSNAVPCSRPHPRWRKHRDGFMQRPMCQDELSQQRGSTNEKLQVCQSSLSQSRGSPQEIVPILCL